MTAKYVMIDGQLYSPRHPRALGLRLPNQAKGSVPDSHTAVEGDCSGQAHVPTPEEALNKTERAYLWKLRERFPNQRIMIQEITLRLAHRTNYTPDFAYTLPTGLLVIVETKSAFIREDAIVKLKTAAAKFPQFTFIKAQFRNGKWTETIMPKA